MIRDFYTAVEAAIELGCDYRDVLDLIHKDPTFPFCKVGGIYVIPKKRLERWLKNHENPVPR